MCAVLGIRLNLNNTQCMTVSLYPPHPNLLYTVLLQHIQRLESLVVVCKSKFTFEKHLLSTSSSVAQKIAF